MEKVKSEIKFKPTTINLNLNNDSHHFFLWFSLYGKVKTQKKLSVPHEICNIF